MVRKEKKVSRLDEDQGRSVLMEDFAQGGEGIIFGSHKRRSKQTSCLIQALRFFGFGPINIFQ